MQSELRNNPKAGSVIRDTGGLRKLRFEDKRRGKGKRGGLRIIYYYWVGGSEFWMLSIYNKGQINDLTKTQRECLKVFLEEEIARKTEQEL